MWYDNVNNEWILFTYYNIWCVIDSVFQELEVQREKKGQVPLCGAILIFTRFFVLQFYIWDNGWYRTKEADAESHKWYWVYSWKKNREKGDTRRGRGRGWEKGPGEERVQRNSVLSRGRRSKTRETRVKNEAGNMGRQKKYRKPKNTRSFGKH